MAIPYSAPATRADWQRLALGLAQLEPVGAQASQLRMLQDLAWDVARRAALWRTLQFPSLAPGLLPWVVVIILMTGAALQTGRVPNLPNLLAQAAPILVFLCTWLMGWYALTLAIALWKHQRMAGQAIRLGRQLGLLAG